MVTSLSSISPNGGSTFKFARPLFTSGGFAEGVDSSVSERLNELNVMLGKRIFEIRTVTLIEPDDGNETAAFSVENLATATAIYPDVKELLSRPLTPRRIAAKKIGRGIPDNHWDDDSLLERLNLEPDDPNKDSLSDYIDATKELSALKYAFQSNFNATRPSLHDNITATLDDYPAIRDYLIAFAYHAMGVQDVNGLSNFIYNNRLGAKNVANYALVSAVRTLIDQKQLIVPTFDQNDGDFVKKVLVAALPMSAAAFQTAAQAVIDDYIFNNKWARILSKATLGTIPPQISQQLLIKYLKQSPVTITEHNINYFLPSIIAQITGPTDPLDTSPGDAEESDRDFVVDFFKDDTSLVNISKSAVRCAAQLFYGMVLGEELDVFNVVNYFTHKYLVRGSIEIQDSRLREDLQMYVFSNRFTNLKTKKVVDRTRPAERQMFYRQVFNAGGAQITDDVIVNDEYPRLWKVLMLESARYIELLQASPKPDGYVSRQNVMQAVEDLQYDLSTHCTGMANVITPLIYAELDFVIKRILMHDEIRRQIVPAGGTWWRVVETLYMELRKARPKATVLYNKAQYGYEIIRSIADYSPAAFDDDKTFSAFISNVDAFITTQSILQEALTDGLKHQDGAGVATNNGFQRHAADLPATPVASGANSEKDAWDF